MILDVNILKRITGIRISCQFKYLTFRTTKSFQLSRYLYRPTKILLIHIFTHLQGRDNVITSHARKLRVSELFVPWSNQARTHRVNGT